MPNLHMPPLNSNHQNVIPMEEGKPSYKEVASNFLPFLNFPSDITFEDMVTKQLDGDSIDLSVEDK